MACRLEYLTSENHGQACQKRIVDVDLYEINRNVDKHVREPGPNEAKQNGVFKSILHHVLAQQERQNRACTRNVFIT